MGVSSIQSEPETEVVNLDPATQSLSCSLRGDVQDQVGVEGEFGDYTLVVVGLRKVRAHRNRENVHRAPAGGSGCAQIESRLPIPIVGAVELDLLAACLGSGWRSSWEDVKERAVREFDRD